MQVQGLKEALIGTVVMALASTFADAFWAAAIPEHRAVYGLAHGGIVLAVMGWTLGWLARTGRNVLAAVAGLLIGVGAAAIFYALYALVGIVAMLIAWMVLWLAFAALTNLVWSPAESTPRTLARGLGAAVMAGVGFWWISAIWLGPHDPGPFYYRNMIAWSIAFLPGFVALLAGRARGN